MKKLLIEIRKYIAVKLLGLAFALMPDCDLKKELSKLIINNILKGI